MTPEQLALLTPEQKEFSKKVESYTGPEARNDFMWLLEQLAEASAAIAELQDNADIGKEFMDAVKRLMPDDFYNESPVELFGNLFSDRKEMEQRIAELERYKAVVEEDVAAAIRKAEPEIRRKALEDVREVWNAFDRSELCMNDFFKRIRALLAEPQKEEKC